MMPVWFYLMTFGVLLFLTPFVISLREGGLNEQSQIDWMRKQPINRLIPIRAAWFSGIVFIVIAFVLASLPGVR